MTIADPSRLESRILFLAPTGPEASAISLQLKGAQFEVEFCTTAAELCEQLNRGVGAVLILEEALSNEGLTSLASWISNQSPWSDVPFILLTQKFDDSTIASAALNLIGNLNVLEMPVSTVTLTSVLLSALRARSRQYQRRDQHLEYDRDHQAQAFLAAIVASSEDAIISKTLNGKILTWNAGAEHLFGYSASEVIGQPITILIPKERHGEETIFLQKLRCGERIEHVETVRRRKDGTLIDVSLSVSPVRAADGTIIAASKVARDISQSKRASEAVRAAQEQLQVVTDNMDVAVARCNRDLRYIWVSSGCAAWLGLPSCQIVGKQIVEVIGPKALDLILPNVQRALAGERVEFEHLIPYKDIGERWVKASYVPTHDSKGLVDGWVAVIMDTTAHHRLEDALREADRRKDEFLAMLAHELRNPLAPIRNSLHILRLSTSEDPTAQRVGEMMERQVNHMVRLVDDLMEVSRITRGKIELRREMVEIAGVVRSAIETSKPLIELAQHQLALALPAEALLVEGDAVRLTQIISNLLNNAAKYTDSGGQIWLTVTHDTNSVSISVRDNGVGIAREMLPKVFDLFTQVDRSVGRSQGGLGIGLTLVKSLVELHGGTVEAKSEGGGKGSEFVVRLPLVQSVSSDDLPASRSGGNGFAVLEPRRVLIVDDNQDAAESLGMLLKVLGADVEVVFSGHDALQSVNINRPALVLLDIGMPVMDGLEVARRIRMNRDYDDITLVALSGWGQDEDRQRSQSAGFDFHLVKPADFTSLQSILTTVIDRTTPRLAN